MPLVNLPTLRDKYSTVTVSLDVEHLTDQWSNAAETVDSRAPAAETVDSGSIPGRIKQVGNWPLDLKTKRSLSCLLAKIT